MEPALTPGNILESRTDVAHAGNGRRIVVIGAGFAGLEAAKILARAGFRLTIVDRRNHHLFQPLLYQVATAALTPADIATPIRRILGRYPMSTC